MSIKMICRSCGKTDIFVTINKAKEAGWIFEDAEIDGQYTPITLCPNCNSTWKYENVVRELIRKAVAVTV